MEVQINTKLGIPVKFMQQIFCDGEDLPDYKSKPDLEADWYKKSKRTFKFLHLRQTQKGGGRGHPVRTAVIAKIAEDTYAICWVAKHYDDSPSKKIATYYAALKLKRAIADMVRNGVNTNDTGNEAMKKPGFQKKKVLRELLRSTGFHSDDGISYEKFQKLGIDIVDYDGLTYYRERCKVANEASRSIGVKIADIEAETRNLLSKQRANLFEVGIVI